MTDYRSGINAAFWAGALLGAVWGGAACAQQTGTIVVGTSQSTTTIVNGNEMVLPGKAPSGATVTVSPVASGEGPPVKATTGDNGEATISGLQPGTYE